MRGWALLVVAMVALQGHAWADVVPQKKWLQVRSPHFTVMGDVAVRELRRVAERMEQLHAALGQLTRVSTADTGDVTVVVFKDQRSFQPFQPRYDGKPAPVAGYFLPGPMNYIGILADRDYDYANLVYHEYVHLAAARALGPLPPWLSEGIAEFYSTFEVMDSGRMVQIGRVPVHHLDRLRHEFLPLATLAKVDRDSPFYNERDKSSAFYAESWALVHFLYLGKERKYGKRFGPFVEALLNGVPFEVACEQQLGTPLPALEQEVRQYLGSLVFTAMRGTLPETLGALARLDATPVPEADAHAALAQLLLFLDQAEDARAHLDHAITVDPKQPLALARLADILAGAGKADEARALLGRAATAPGATYLSQFYRASALEHLGATDSAALVSAWRDVTTLNPNFAEGLTRLAQARADARDDLDEALTLQRRAMELTPGRDEYILGFARILIMRGDTRAAREVLGPLVARGSTPRIKTAARSYLGMAAQVELARAAGTEAPMAARPPEGPSAPQAPPPGAPAPAATGRPDLRPPQAGEAQAFGTLAAIECAQDGSVLVLQTAGGSLRMRGGTLDRVEFVSFRPDVAGGISCGAQPQALPVLTTYRPGPQADTVGEVVVVEVVPAGFKPPGW